MRELIVMNLHRLICLALFSTVISACGGGGGSEGTSGGSSVKPSNTPPAASLSTNNVTLDELEKTSIELTFSDNETPASNLTVSVVSSNDDALSVSYDSGTLSLTAHDVMGDSVVTVTATISDGSASTRVTATVTVTDTSALIPAPIISIDSNVVQVTINQTLNVSYSVSYDESASFLSETVTSSDESILSAQLVEQQISVKGISAGQATFTYTVVDTNNNTSNVLVTVDVMPAAAPKVNLTSASEIDVNSELLLEYDVVYADGARHAASGVTVSNESILSASISQGHITLIGKALGKASYTVSITDSNGSVGSVTHDISVVESNNVAPDITLAGLDENESLVIYGKTENKIPIIITDPDDDSHSWYLNKLEGIDFPDARIDYIYSYHTDFKNKLLTITTNLVPARTNIAFELELAVKDKKTTTFKRFTLILTQTPNGAPLFSLSDQVVNFGPVPEGDTREFTYSIVDDNPENVEVTGIKSWYGDETLFDYKLDTTSQTITVTNKGVPLSETFGVLITYKDGDSVGDAGFNFKSSAVLGEYEQSILDYVQEMENKVAATKEYYYVADFYSEVIENKNLISPQKAEDLQRAVQTVDSVEYGIIGNLLSVMEANAISGTLTNVDEMESYKSAINARFIDLEAELTSQTYVYVNELAELSTSILPVLDFENKVYEYDATLQKYSRFAGNPSYGEFVDGEWVFNDEYKFLNAIIAKSFSEAKKVYKY